MDYLSFRFLLSKMDKIRLQASLHKRLMER